MLPESQPVGRARLSCAPCRKRKSKCDEGSPCSSCVTHATIDACQPPTASTSRAGAKQSRPPHVLAATLQQTGTSNKRARRESASRAAGVQSSEAVGHEDVMEQMDKLREEMDRLRDRLVERQRQSEQQQKQRASPVDDMVQGTLPARQHPNPLPPRDAKLQALVRTIFPSQNDCEVLLEYVMQEPEWLVNCVTWQWILPIWSRLVYGCRVRQVEVAILAGLLSVSCVLLDETPHVYYELSAPPVVLQKPLLDFLCEFVKSHEQPAPHVNRPDDPELLDNLIVYALVAEFMRIAGRRKAELGALSKKVIRASMQRSGFMDESSPAWSSFDDLERQTARRVAWHILICERWASIYVPVPSPIELRKEHVKVQHPRWKTGHLTRPFRAHRDSALLQEEPIVLRAPARNVPRVFRLKADDEDDDVARFGELMISISAITPDIGSYLSAVTAWRASVSNDSSPSDSASTSTSAARRGSEHKRESLLHQGLALYEEVSTWKDELPQFMQQLYTLDGNDFHACRRASQAAIAFTGARSLITGILSPWVTEHVYEEGASPIHLKMQGLAVANAEAVVRSIEVTRTLLSCKRAVYFGSWAAYSFFNAATTLAIPLLGATRLGQEAKGTSGRLAKIFVGFNQTNSNPQASLAKFINGVQNSERSDYCLPSDGLDTSKSASGSGGQQASVAEHLRQLAPDILRLLHLLPDLRGSPLGQETSQRISTLIDTFKINQQPTTLSAPSAAAARPIDYAAQSSVQAPMLSTPGFGSDSGVSFDSFPGPALVEQQTPAGFGGVADWRDVRGFEVLDSLVSLSDEWWNDLMRGAVPATGTTPNPSHPPPGAPP
ncbi:HEME-RESPONSIVE ZINC FINGER TRANSCRIPTION FACTOR HAP1 [Ceraceosorus bombacis]|uniref:HEME-RESPONSIVE ZINC FINGER TRANSCRIPTION FACTOR HAP1 n=1 Tax=Ceraceosorus bombacis TaxID=401625 RepID=A0A0P1BFN0_9BASI|nr:HEME-RESPONSIVE ZINC FINGER TRANSCRIPTION FACTOR HAP1 [Ceraceosorus bombacis]